MNYQDKRIAVIGLGVSNTPLIRYLANEGAKVTVFDKKNAVELEKYLLQLRDIDFEYRLGEDYLSYLHGKNYHGVGIIHGNNSEELSEAQGFEIIFVTPGMKKDLPEFHQAKAEGAGFSSEMELFLSKVPGKTIGITGSSGKTTTTTLIGQMIAKDFPDSFMGGNIGKSLLDELPRMNQNSRIVLELSSFQLQELKQSPQLSVITNITPNHLDMHASMQEYIDAKNNILAYQTFSDIAVLNYDNELTRNLSATVKGKLYYFSRLSPLDEGAFLDGNELILKLNGQKEVISSREKLKLLGDHNVENILTAALVARLTGVGLATITNIAESFAGVEHRLELVRELKGVKYYNDSISTTPDRAIAGLKAMTQPTWLIVGGYDKHLPFDRLATEMIKKCKHLLVLGVTAPQIITEVRKLDPDFPMTHVSSIEESVSIASKKAEAGEVVLLSPACASYDMFNNYQERGKLFKDLVEKL